MTYHETARRLGLKMCEAWGLDPAYVRRIEVIWEPFELPHAEVELLLTEGVVRELLTLSVIHREPSP